VPVSALADRILALHGALDAARIPHAFGGAIALAYCTEEPRGTRDIDLNVFVGVDEAPRVLSALPPGIAIGEETAEDVRRDVQVRLWWDGTPVYLFFDAHEFHREAAAGARVVPFAGDEIPVLACDALAVLKALFHHTRDWADVEAMRDASVLDATFVVGWVTRLLGAGHPGAARLAAVLA
jgi:hypothetical protein